MVSVFADAAARRLARGVFSDRSGEGFFDMGTQANSALAEKTQQISWTRQLEAKLVEGCSVRISLRLVWDPDCGLWFWDVERVGDSSRSSDSGRAKSLRAARCQAVGALGALLRWVEERYARSDGVFLAATDSTWEVYRREGKKFLTLGQGEAKGIASAQRAAETCFRKLAAEAKGGGSHDGKSYG